MSRWRDLVEQDNAKKITEEEETEEYPTLEELESDLQNTLDDLNASFRERAKREKQRYAQTCNSTYYFTVYFSNKEQLVEFCENFDMDYTQYYFDGRELARKFKRALRTSDTNFAKVKGFTKEYVDRAAEIK